MSSIDFNSRPILVFWETTQSCLLACRHCRANAVVSPAPGELNLEDGYAFIDSLTKFGHPYPVLILTGGDVLMRPDIFELVEYATRRGIPVGMAPSVTPLLTDRNMDKMHQFGVKIVSISMDGAGAEHHDEMRGVKGHFDETVAGLRRLVQSGLQVQVNTVVTRDNVHELPAIVQLLKQIGVSIWEVFFLVSVGRGVEVAELSAADCEDVAHFLVDASQYDLVVRTVEAPFFRRVVQWRKAAVQRGLSTDEVVEAFGLGPLYMQLFTDLHQRLGAFQSEPRCQTRGTRDGKGILFVRSDGTIFPSGFLPIPLGNVRSDNITDVYRDHPLLRDIRASRFGGRCGRCDFRDLCGGSRARAYARTRDALAEDPACFYQARDGS